MDWTAIREGLIRLAPEAGLTVLLLLVVIVDLLSKRSRLPAALVALGGLAALTVLGVAHFGNYASLEGGAIIFGGSASADKYSLFFRVAFLVAGIITLLFSIPVVSKWPSGQGEFYALLLSCTLGACMMAMANDLLMMYLSLEFVSITSYVMAGLLPRNRRSAEASLKYIIYGAGASGMMIYGMSFLYGITGTLGVDAVGRALLESDTIQPQMALVISVFVMAGFGYKIAAVPFHMWCPDVYEGSPTPVTAYFSVVPKAAGFAMLARFVSGVFQTSTPDALPALEWKWILAGLAIATMAVGNFAAIGQQNLKRLMAYSSIGHAGILLVGFAAFTPENLEAILFYVIAYLVMNLGAFLVLIVLEEKYGIETVEQCRGLGWKSPLLCGIMVLFLLSLTGLPPTAGFVAKLLVFGYLVKTWDPLNITLAVIGVLFSVVALYYYARIMAAMFLGRPREGEPEGTAVAPVAMALLVILGLATLAIGVAPGWLQELAKSAATGLTLR